MNTSHKKLLTIGMAHHAVPGREADSAGAYFTITGLRANHGYDFELVVIDNSPIPDDRTRDVCLANGGQYFHKPNLYGTSAPRDEVFRVAETPWVMCVDSHVIFENGAIASLVQWTDKNPDSSAFIQGPLVYDNRTLSTHWQQTTPPGLWGTWAYDQKVETGNAFEISMQGLGVFAMRKEAWPGFNPLFTGFGGEEGYIHELVRRRGGKCLCLPALAWRHWFRDPKQSPPYSLRLEDHVWNLLIGHRELGIHAVEAIHKDFGSRLPPGIFDQLKRGADLAQPWNQPGVRPAPLKVLGVWYSNNSAPQKLLIDSLTTIKRAADLSRADVKVSTIPMKHIEGNPFFEFGVPGEPLNGPGHLNIIRQIKAGFPMTENSHGRPVTMSWQPDVVCFLEHDVLYPPDYFDRVALAFNSVPTANVVSNQDYEGLNATGWLKVRERHEPLHQLSMRYEFALKNLERAEQDCHNQGWALLEPQGPRTDWVRLPHVGAYGRMPAIHVNHTSGRFTSHGEVVFEQQGTSFHRFWGDYKTYWPYQTPSASSQESPQGGCGCNQPAVVNEFKSISDWFEAEKNRASDFNEHCQTLKELADKCETVAEYSVWDDKPAIVALAASSAKTVISVCPLSKRIWAAINSLSTPRTGFKTSDNDGLIRDGVDLLYIDTGHNAKTVGEELERYKSSVKKYIVIHCTMTYGDVGDDGSVGVMAGIRKFIHENKEWTAIRHDKNNHGLVVMSRLDEDRKQPPGMVRKALNFSKALLSHAKAGQKLVNDKVHELRMAECIMCPDRAFDVCSLCGCNLAAKTSWADQKCPKDPPQWVPTTDPDDLEP